MARWKQTLAEYEGRAEDDPSATAASAAASAAAAVVARPPTPPAQPATPASSPAPVAPAAVPPPAAVQTPAAAAGTAAASSAAAAGPATEAGGEAALRRDLAFWGPRVFDYSAAGARGFAVAPRTRPRALVLPLTYPPACSPRAVMLSPAHHPLTNLSRPNRARCGARCALTPMRG
jgi:hypothetical protein